MNRGKPADRRLSGDNTVVVSPRQQKGFDSFVGFVKK
jgi:hypothetical protein